MDKLKLISDASLKADAPELNIGSTVRVHVKIREGNRERIQVFEGTVIAKRGSGISSTFTVRRVSYGVGIERRLLFRNVIEQSGEARLFLPHQADGGGLHLERLAACGADLCAGAAARAVERGYCNGEVFVLRALHGEDIG